MIEPFKTVLQKSDADALATASVKCLAHPDPDVAGQHLHHVTA